MRQEYVEAETIDQVRELCPWAAVVVEVNGGFLAFESVEDGKTWEAQR